MGKAIRNFKRAVAQNENIEVHPISDAERKQLQNKPVKQASDEIVDAEVIDDTRVG